LITGCFSDVNGIQNPIDPKLHTPGSTGDERLPSIDEWLSKPCFHHRNPSQGQAMALMSGVVDVCTFPSWFNVSLL
jgi:hypothetical protein